MSYQFIYNDGVLSTDGFKNTYYIKEQLRQQGFKWTPITKKWWKIVLGNNIGIVLDKLAETTGEQCSLLAEKASSSEIAVEGYDVVVEFTSKKLEEDGVWHVIVKCYTGVSTISNIIPQPVGKTFPLRLDADAWIKDMQNLFVHRLQVRHMPIVDYRQENVTKSA